MLTVSVIGAGFVGQALLEGFPRLSERAQTSLRVVAYDKHRPERTSADLTWMATHSDFIFVCVPTPMWPDGRCDTSIVRDVIGELHSLSVRCPVVIKSTVPPGTCATLAQEFRDVRIVFNPEFLTESRGVDDFVAQDRVFLGSGPRLEEIGGATALAGIYRRLLPDAHVEVTSWAQAEMVKYVANCFLAVKVSFANEMKQACDAMGLSYDSVIGMASRDRRLGESHWKVPGPVCVNDARAEGFGGACFPKDINAMIHVMRGLGVEPLVLEAAWKKNLQVRPPWARDWETQSRSVRMTPTAGDDEQ